ncbi:MAG: putative Ig domain-containing protein, partial [Anaerolineaceae bacterium]
ALPNSIPIATPQTLDAVSGVTLPITLSGTDADGDPLTYMVITQPQYGAVTEIVPNIGYVADPGYQGEDSFTFTVSDGLATSAAATITLHVTAVPWVNGALPDQTAYVHLPFRYTFRDDVFIDNPGDTLTYTARLGTGDPLPAWLTFDAAARTFSGTPPAGSAGTALVIQLTATDSGGASGSISFNLNVLPPPHSLYVPLVLR